MSEDSIRVDEVLLPDPHMEDMFDAEPVLDSSRDDADHAQLSSPADRGVETLVLAVGDQRLTDREKPEVVDGRQRAVDRFDFARSRTGVHVGVVAFDADGDAEVVLKLAPPKSSAPSGKAKQACRSLAGERVGVEVQASHGWFMIAALPDDSINQFEVPARTPEQLTEMATEPAELPHAPGPQQAARCAPCVSRTLARAV